MTSSLLESTEIEICSRLSSGPPCALEGVVGVPISEARAHRSALHEALRLGRSRQVATELHDVCTDVMMLFNEILSRTSLPASQVARELCDFLNLASFAATKPALKSAVWSTLDALLQPGPIRGVAPQGLRASPKGPVQWIVLNVLRTQYMVFRLLLGRGTVKDDSIHQVILALQLRGSKVTQSLFRINALTVETFRVHMESGVKPEGIRTEIQQWLHYYRVARERPIAYTELSSVLHGLLRRP